MARTVVLLHKIGNNFEQLTNSNLTFLDCPKTGDMPQEIHYDGKVFTFLDQVTHETDHEGDELYRYLTGGGLGVQ